MNLSHYTNLDINVSTMIKIDRSTPIVMIHIERPSPIFGGAQELVLGIQLSPGEAREVSAALTEGAEAVEHTANLTVALRENKIPEEVITAVIATMRERREQI